MAESKEELKSLLMKVEEESKKAGLKLSSFTFIKRLFSFSALSSIRVMSAAVPAKSRQLCPTLCDPIDAAQQGPLSLGFSR